jgi:hypothetical protein
MDLNEIASLSFAARGPTMARHRGFGVHYLQIACYPFHLHTGI